MLGANNDIDHSLPRGWEQAVIGEHADVITGFRFSSSDYSYDMQDIRILRGENIGQGRLKWEETRYWDPEKYNSLAKYHLQAGDLVVALDRTLVRKGLKVAEVKQGELPMLLGQRVARLRAKPSIDQRLLHCMLLSLMFKQYVEQVQTTTAIPHIGLPQVKQFTLRLPPMPEQRRIGDILSTWNDAIEAANNLLNTARNQHEAMMQALLTGRQRFPEYADHAWRRVRLSDLMDGKKVKGRQVNINEEGMGLAYIGASAINGNNPSFTTDSDIVPCRQDDLLLLWDGFKAGIAATGLDGAVASTVMRYRLKLNLVQSEFLLALMELRRNQICNIREGSGIPHLPQDFDTWFQVSLPSLPEQRKITALLDLAKQEVNTFLAQLNQLESERQALFHELLTGQRRVISP